MLHRVERRSGRILGGVLALIAVIGLAGCGGSGGSGPTEPVNTAVLKEGVRPLPMDGSVRVGAVTPDSVELEGAVPSNLAAGQVVVSGIGEGFVRRIRTATPTQSGVRLETEPATLEDVFQQARIQYRSALRASDFRSVEPLIDGVELATPVGPAAASRSIDLLKFNFSKLEIGNHEVTGGVSVNVDLDVMMEYDAEGLKELRFAPAMTSSSNLKVVGKLKGEVATPELPFAKAVGAPIVIMAGPVPIPVVPELTLFAQVKGATEGGIELSQNFRVRAVMGYRYTRLEGLQPIATLEREGSFLPDANVYASAKAEVNIAAANLTTKVLALAGPFVEMKLLSLEFEFKAEVNPRNVQFTASYVQGAAVGLEAENAFFTVAQPLKYELFESKTPFFTKKYLHGGSDIIID